MNQYLKNIRSNASQTCDTGDPVQIGERKTNRLGDLNVILLPLFIVIAATEIFFVVFSKSHSMRYSN